MSEDGIVKIHGKDYHTVAKRVQDFLSDNPDWSIEPEIQSNDEEVLIKVSIKDHEGRVRSVGHASEIRSSSTINKTSALENCETSAVGRALAFLGYAGTEIASSNEMNSVAAQNQQMLDRVFAHNETLRLYINEVSEVVDRIEDGDLEAASEAWSSIPQESQVNLWLATTKGGIFTTEHRSLMKSNEWAEVRKQPSPSAGAKVDEEEKT